MLAGASEAAIVPLCVAGFNNMTALSRNDDPATASRPFDLNRDGFVPGEGAGMLVLEALDHALERGAKIYAELMGYGHTSDAYHITAPMETGEGAAKAVEFALRDAVLAPNDIDYINAHGTSTPLNDAAETNALKRSLGETAYNIPVSSTKSMTGHLLGGGAAIEAIFSIMAIRNNFVPPTIHLEAADPACDLNYVPNVGIKHEVSHVMSNAFGLAGTMPWSSSANIGTMASSEQTNDNDGAIAIRRYAHIIGWGMAVPETVLTNDELSSFVDTNDEWIFARTGIRQRHIADEGESTATLAYLAAQQALEVADILPTDLDLIIVATSTPENIFPSTASLVQDWLNAHEAAPST